MCEQCYADCHTLIEGVLPNFSLVQAHKDGHFMKKGQFGLVEINDPTFVWDLEPMVGLTFNMSDEVIDSLPNEGPVFEEMMSWFSRVEEFEKQAMSQVHVEDGYKLYIDCLAKGYDPKTHGYRIASWLFNFLGEQLFYKFGKNKSHSIS